MKMAIVSESGGRVGTVTVTSDGVKADETLPDDISPVIDEADELLSINAANPDPKILPRKPVGIGTGKVESTSAEIHTPADVEQRRTFIERALKQLNHYAIPESKLNATHPAKTTNPGD